MVPVDNKSTISLNKNLIQHSRKKHFDSKHHFIPKCVGRGNLSIEYVSREAQLVDSLKHICIEFNVNEIVKAQPNLDAHSLCE